MPAPQTVFISYSHADEPWKDRLLPHLTSLETAGIAMQVWHDRKIDGGDRWYPEIEAAMAQSAVAILLISSDFLASTFCVKEEVPALLKRQEEEGMLLIPVLLRACPWKAHRWLAERQMIPRDGRSIAIDHPGALADAVFADITEQVLAEFERRATDAPVPTPPPRWPALPVDRIDLTHLPTTGRELFGRDAELARLDAAWAGPPAGDAAVRVLAFTAHGGVGKSTLVNHWLGEAARDHFRGASDVFGWSFFSQGVRQQATASADAFVSAALRFFGDPDPTLGSPWDKGARLAHLVGRRRALLVLDGLEPLQSAQPFERGKLRDAALESLLRGLARQSAGLCLITTREPLADLAGRPGVEARDLEQIDAQAGRALLRTDRVVGTDAQLEALAADFGPHALAVSLLGAYLRQQPGHSVAPAAALQSLPGKAPIDRVLLGFEQWLRDGPERQALRLLGLFDRPADAGCLDALRRAPAIDGLTERLVGLDDAAWQAALQRLDGLRLVQVQRGPDGIEAVDAHPLVREHFAEQLAAGGAEAWRAGHERLFEHLCGNTDEGDAPTLEQLQPLYQAVVHGCKAGLQQRACDAVYHHRILRGRRFHSSNMLGAYGSNLGAIACFFDNPWRTPSPALTTLTKAWLLGQASFSLASLGRPEAASEPLRAALALAVEQPDWLNAAIYASNLSQLELSLGAVQRAVEDGGKSVIQADRGDDAFQRMVNRATHADALHQAGRYAEANDIFREAEAMQSSRQPEYPLLYSSLGFQYGELLLTGAERAAARRWNIDGDHRVDARWGDAREACSAVASRGQQVFGWRTPGDSLLSIALDHLTLGRCTLFEGILSANSPATLVLPASCTEHLALAIGALRQAGKHDHLPGGLLTRAWQRALTGPRTGADSAQADLDEAFDIAERGPMRLHLVDIHLCRARLFGPHLAQGEAYPWRSPQHDLAEARRLIEQCGYGRRLGELEDAEAESRRWQSRNGASA